MLDPLTNSLPTAVPNLFPAGSYAIREVSIGRIIPDLLVSGLTPAVALLGRSRPTFLDCQVISMAHEPQGISAERLLNDLYVPEETAARVLTRLVHRGILTGHPSGYVLSEPEAFQQLNLVAFEVKMRRWRQALAQAQTYLRFANNSVVVLDGNQVRVTESVRDEFRAAKVGLLLQYGQIVLTEVTACATQVMSAERIWAFAKLAEFARRTQRVASTTHTLRATVPDAATP